MTQRLHGAAERNAIRMEHARGAAMADCRGQRREQTTEQQPRRARVRSVYWGCFHALAPSAEMVEVGKPSWLAREKKHGARQGAGKPRHDMRARSGHAAPSRILRGPRA